MALSADRLHYLAGWRMTIAAQRLRDDDAVIADVAEAVGYTNPVAFSKAFVRMQGVGPGTFRREARHARRAPVQDLETRAKMRSVPKTTACERSTRAYFFAAGRHTA